MAEFSERPPVGRRMLGFFDDTEVGLIGLDHIMAELYSEGRKASDEAVPEIIKRLDAKKTIFPPLKVPPKSTLVPC